MQVPWTETQKNLTRAILTTPLLPPPIPSALPSPESGAARSWRVSPFDGRQRPRDSDTGTICVRVTLARVPDCLAGEPRSRREANDPRALHSLSHLLGSSIRYCLVISSSFISHSYLARTSAILCWRCSRIFSFALKHMTSWQEAEKEKRVVVRREKNLQLQARSQPTPRGCSSRKGCLCVVSGKELVTGKFGRDLGHPSRISVVTAQTTQPQGKTMEGIAQMEKAAGVPSWSHKRLQDRQLPEPLSLDHVSGRDTGSSQKCRAASQPPPPTHTRSLPRSLPGSPALLRGTAPIPAPRTCPGNRHRVGRRWLTLLLPPRRRCSRSTSSIS